VIHWFTSKGSSHPSKEFFMSSVTLYRASGLALLLGAALVIIGLALATVFKTDTPLGTVMIGVASCGIALLTLGSPGIVARQASRAGWLGFFGFLLLLLNWLLLLGVGAMLELTILPWLGAYAPQVSTQLLSTDAALAVYIGVRYVLLVLGGVLLGSATMRAGVFSRWAGLLLIAGAVLAPASYALVLFSTMANVLVSLALGWMGYTLWTTKGEAVPQPVQRDIASEARTL
jgi:predicted DNA-binding transcriptional regulator